MIDREDENMSDRGKQIIVKDIPAHVHRAFKKYCVDRDSNMSIEIRNLMDQVSSASNVHADSER